MKRLVIGIILISSCCATFGKNVLLIIADDLGLESQVYGNDVCKTPNIEKLSHQGIVFDKAFTSVSSCSPSRSAILTGIPSHQNGMYGLHQGYHHFNSFDRVLSLSAILRQNGIRTGIIGKKHVGPETVYPFDFSYTENTHSILQVGRNITYIKELTKLFLSTDDSRPFFLYVAFHDPHRCGHTHPEYGQFCEKFGNGEPGMGVISDWTPIYYTPSEVIVPKFVQDTPAARSDIAAQYTTISRLDQGIGLALNALKDSIFNNNTLVLFSSDNGIPFPNGRTNAYDPGIVEPMILSSPMHRFTWGKRTNILVSLLDITPTILDWYGLKYPKTYIFKNDQPIVLTGKSLLSILANQTKEKSEAVFVSHTNHEVTMSYPIRSVRTMRYKLIENLNYRMPYPIDQDFYLSPTFQDLLNRTRSHSNLHWFKSLMQYYYRPHWELYDLTFDPLESTNIAYQFKYKKVFYKLRKKLKKWQQKTNDPWQCFPNSVLEDAGSFSHQPKCLPLYNNIY